MSTDAFYLFDGDDRFISTEWTIGPWGPDSQHAGPPAALLGRALERVVGRDDMQLARATFEILRPIPIARLQVGAEVIRPGKSVTLATATLSAEDGEVMRAQGWLIRRGDDLGLPHMVTADPPAQGPDAGGGVDLFPTSRVSYLTAMEWRFIKGMFLEQGPATAWARMRVPLVDDEEITPLSRALVLADSGNGISSALDFDNWIFINCDLTVYLHRLPMDEWVCLDAVTTIEPSGIGLAASVLSDEEGVIGRGLQALFVAPRRR
jgi:acyl-Coa thioesterase superfamily protein/acyl-CoA thioesterase superfamily protein